MSHQEMGIHKNQIKYSINKWDKSNRHLKANLPKFLTLIFNFHINIIIPPTVTRRIIYKLSNMTTLNFYNSKYIFYNHWHLCTLISSLAGHWRRSHHEVSWLIFFNSQRKRVKTIENRIRYWHFQRRFWGY